MVLLQDTILEGDYGEAICKFVNDRLTQIVEKISKKIEGISEFDAVEILSKYFPDFYPRVQMRKTFLNLLKKLKDEEELELNIMEEYLLAAMMRETLKECEKNGVSSVKKMENRDLILKEIINQGIAEDIEEARVFLEIAEDLECYEVLCFEDIDFMFLDRFSLKEFRRSGLAYDLDI